MPIVDPADADLPVGEWTHVLIGHQWPASAALAVLDAAAASRSALGAAHDGYAEALRSVQAEIASHQRGVAATGAEEAFRRGEQTAREVCARNIAKKDCYRSAQRWVADLRSDLGAIAASGNAAIRRVLDSDAPAVQKLDAIVHTVAEAREQANVKAAQCGANLYGAIQQVLDTRNPGASAREFARSNGVLLDRAFTAPRLADVRSDVAALLDGPAAGDTVGAGSPAVPETDTGTAGEPAAVPDPGPGTVAASFIGAGPAPAPETGRAAPAPAGPAATLPPALPGIRRDATAWPTAGQASGSTPGMSPSRAARIPGPLPAYGSGQGGSPSTAPTSPTRPGPVAITPQPPAPAPTGIGGLFSRSTAQGSIIGSPPARAPAAAPPARALRDLLAAVARQEPRLSWAVGAGPDGRVLLVTDLGGGWIPPHIDVPAGLDLLEPAARRGDITALLGPGRVIEIYRPGQPLTSGGPVPTSPTARATAPIPELAWELRRATRWHDGLPRLAHTLARAICTGTGWLQSEADLLAEHLQATAAGVLAGYPDAVDPGAVGCWQLLAAIAAQMAGDPDLAGYHFAWFAPWFADWSADWSAGQSHDSGPRGR